MNVKIISSTQNPLDTMAYAASRCYMSEPNEAVVKSCWKSGHRSIAEHCYFTFEITGVSRACLAQLTRHRIASYSVTSQRYVDCGDFDMVVPHNIDIDNKSKEVFNDCIDVIRDSYKTLQDLGQANENARSILPNACSTNIVMTINLRSLANFMNERLCKRAQDEINMLARRMKSAVLSLNTWSDEFRTFLDKNILVPKCEKEEIHFCPEYKSCGRHKKAKEINAILENK